VERLKADNIVPGLSVILVGDDPASHVYVRNKEKACAEVGINSRTYRLPAETDQGEVLTLLEQLNGDDSVHGILVQLPVPPQIDSDVVLRAIAPEKDVDGFLPTSIGNLVLGNAGYKPCTPLGCMVMLERTGIDIKGKKAVVVGRSNIVGKPIAMMLLEKHATVTVCHSRTADLGAETKQADILVAAVGRPEMIKGDMVRPGAVVLDVGINRLEDGRLVGDVHFESTAEVAGWITPVPGGVGPMTITMLLHNTVQAAESTAGT